MNNPNRELIVSVASLQKRRLQATLQERSVQHFSFEDVIRTVMAYARNQDELHLADRVRQDMGSTMGYQVAFGISNEEFPRPLSVAKPTDTIYKHLEKLEGERGYVRLIVVGNYAVPGG